MNFVALLLEKEVNLRYTQEITRHKATKRQRFSQTLHVKDGTKSEVR